MIKPDNIYFEIVVYIQVVYPELSPTGRHSTYPGLILTYVWKIVSIVSFLLLKRTHVLPGS